MDENKWHVIYEEKAFGETVIRNEVHDDEWLYKIMPMINVTKIILLRNLGNN